MPAELVNMADQFRGLPMADLIGGPMIATIDAQTKMAQATINYIETIGFLPAKQGDKQSTCREANFSFTRPVTRGDGEGISEQTVSMSVPVLSIVPIPALMVDNVTVDFEMEVKSCFSSKETQDMSAKADASAKLGWGIFSLDVHFQGSVASHQEQQRQSDNSAKYNVHVQASQHGMPEGLAKVLDILSTAVAPTELKETKPTPPKS